MRWLADFLNDVEPTGVPSCARSDRNPAQQPDGEIQGKQRANQVSGDGLKVPSARVEI